MWYSCINTLAVWDYFGKEEVFAVITNPNTRISKIIDFVRPVDDWSEMVFSGRQNAENVHCETLN